MIWSPSIIPPPLSGLQHLRVLFWSAEWRFSVFFSKQLIKFKRKGSGMPSVGYLCVPKQHFKVYFLNNLCILAEGSFWTPTQNGWHFQRRFPLPSLRNRLRCCLPQKASSKSRSCTWDGWRRTVGSRGVSFESSWTRTWYCSGSRPCPPRSRHTLNRSCSMGGNILLDSFPLEENNAVHTSIFVSFNIFGLNYFTGLSRPHSKMFFFHFSLPAHYKTSFLDAPEMLVVWRKIEFAYCLEN